ncbi:MAG TPA: Nif3-like dinuclear metal center hexameric protein, partial [Aquaticitalea sp.]|nr:Nif3-like dinuclear metal center hexameric protein [Aquaticitalea sp.]
DNCKNGVNDIICNVLGLKNKQILMPKYGTIKKLVTYVPKNDAEKVRKALFASGAGHIGNYENCSFNLDGIGTFKGNGNSNPVKGKKGEDHQEHETQIVVTFKKHLEQKVLQSLFDNHPYEEVAFEVTTLDNYNQNIGMGMVGELDEAMEAEHFLIFAKKIMGASIIRHSATNNKTVKRIAVLGGSGSFAIPAAKAAGADVLLTSDLKYHDFFLAENQIILADIGHYESEQFTKNFLVDYLSKKIINFAPALPKGRVVLSTTNTNPVKYL